MGAFISRPTSPQAITAAIVWLYTKLFPGKAPVRPYVSKAFSISRENSSATQELAGLSDRAENLDLFEDLQSFGPRPQGPYIETSVELGSPERCRPAVISRAKKSMKGLDDANAEMLTPTLIMSTELLDDSGISQSVYSDFTDRVGFSMHMLQTTSSLIKRRRKAQADVNGSPSSTRSPSTERSKRCKTARNRTPDTSERVFKTIERRYLRETVSSRLKCRQKLSLNSITALPASSCA